MLCERQLRSLLSAAFVLPFAYRLFFKLIKFLIHPLLLGPVYVSVWEFTVFLCITGMLGYWSEGCGFYSWWGLWDLSFS